MSEVKAERRHRALAASTLSAGGAGAQHWVNTGKTGKGIVDPDLLKLARAFAEQESELLTRRPWGPTELTHVPTVRRIATQLQLMNRADLAERVLLSEGTLAVKANSPELDDPAVVFSRETAAGNAFIDWCKLPSEPMTHGNLFMSGYVYGVKAMGG